MAASQPAGLPLLKAASLATERKADALFSITPGKLALFFFHEGYAWKCEKRP